MQATETKVTYSRGHREAERPWQRQEALASPGLQLLLEQWQEQADFSTRDL